MKNENFDQTRLDQALVALTRLLNALSEIAEIILLQWRIYALAIILIPVGLCFLSVVLWFLGDAILAAVPK